MLIIIIVMMMTIVFNQLLVSKVLNHHEMNLDHVDIPSIVNNKSATLNEMGYVFFMHTPLGQKFLENEANHHKKVLEIGSGFSNLTLDALKKKSNHYTVNDISEDHLKILACRIKTSLGESFLNNITFIAGPAPDVLPAVIQEYDAIIADKIIHFLPPPKIIELIRWIKIALKKNGKVYITASSPYAKAYHSILPTYLKRSLQHEQFPGHFTNMMKNIDPEVIKNNPSYKLPDEMVLFSEQDLIHLLEREGMKILQTYSLKIPSEAETTWSEVPDRESNIVGIIAEA